MSFFLVAGLIVGAVWLVVTIAFLASYKQSLGS
jgi:hypothetical protein